MYVGPHLLLTNMTGRERRRRSTAREGCRAGTDAVYSWGWLYSRHLQYFSLYKTAIAPHLLRANRHGGPPSPLVTEGKRESTALCKGPGKTATVKIFKKILTY
jgi:hypothetical protein